MTTRITLLILLISSCTSSTNRLLNRPYFGLNTPEQSPQLFAPGIVSGPYDDRMIVFLNNGTECYFQRRGAPKSVVFYMQLTNTGWTEPETAFFSGRYFEEFAFSQDGNTLVYTSNQPKPNSTFNGEFYLWKCVRENGNWSNPEFLGEQFRGAGYPSISNKGNIYFFDKKPDGKGENDIYFSSIRNGTYNKPVLLNDVINSPSHEVDPFISPDESFLLFCSNKTDGHSIYISFKDSDGKWQKALSLGTDIGEGDAICPTLSDDANYLFFCSNRYSFPNFANKKISYTAKMNILNSAGNGSNDIYWVNFSELLKRLEL